MARKMLLILAIMFSVLMASGHLPEELPIEIIFEPEREPVVQEPEAPESVIPETTLYDVVRVIDGDTVIIKRNGVDETVRLIGIDTPETVHPSKPVQCFGNEASARTKAWLTGEQVSLEFDSSEGERDKYQRLLAYVRRSDGFLVNLELIRQGYAYEYTHDLPYQYQVEFKSAEAEARVHGRGLWADSACAS